MIGDTQLTGNTDSDKDAVDLLTKIGGDIAKENTDFGLQTGDYVDNAGYSDKWTQIINLFGSCFGSTDIVHVLGNHEYYGDESGKISNRLIGGDGRDYYSVEYDDVYVAVINNGADMAEAAEWLKEDALKSDCQWKVLSVHQPPYYTNEKGSSQGFNKNIPPMAEAAGIDAVFSGHDHSYAEILAKNQEIRNTRSLLRTSSVLRRQHRITMHCIFL